MSKRMQSTIVSAFLSVAALVAAPGVHAVQQVGQDFTMPMKIRTTVESFECYNSPGPQITFQGGMLLDALNLRLIFRNNINKDVHTREEVVTSDVGLIEEGQEIVLPKQPVEGGVGGNPYIYFQLVDTNNGALTDPALLGRCVQGLFQPVADIAKEVAAAARLTVSQCENSPGPYIRVDGEMSVSPGIKARFIFKNNKNKDVHTAEAVRDLLLVANGETVQFPKQPVEGGVGGNPYISTQFLDGNGEPIGTETLLGKCVQLSK